ncbi:hypothetical protein [Nitrosomonas sp. Nm33]|uniref:hypothetical protein n=1 Tax=Nitrosomonas sp. Nm33 TaxID=133724 RepID=UPI0015A29F51|nr:hypothetical protein [Nitrosomonas sp. Nm33]
MRYELGNKESYMGVYGPDLLMSEFPSTLPKLCVVATISTPIDQLIKSFTLIISKDDEVLAETPIEDTNFELQSSLINHDKNHATKLIQFRGVFQLVPFPMDKECVLKVKAKIEDDELIGPSLRIISGQTKPENT